MLVVENMSSKRRLSEESCPAIPGSGVGIRDYEKIVESAEATMNLVDPEL